MRGIGCPLDRLKPESLISAAHVLSRAQVDIRVIAKLAKPAITVPVNDPADAAAAALNVHAGAASVIMIHLWPVIGGHVGLERKRRPAYGALTVLLGEQAGESLRG